MTLTDILERNARMYPELIALIELRPSENSRRIINWLDFDQKANRIANALIDRGIKKGDKVLHWMRNSIDWLLVFFGIAKTGAWVVPLSYRFIHKDIKYCADVAESKVIILDSGLADKIIDKKKEMAGLTEYIAVGESIPEGMGSLTGILSESSPEHPRVTLNNEDECALFFTSGTTGDPKPVLLTHRNLECTCITEWAHHQQSLEDNFIIIPPLYHLGALGHWLGSFIVGGRGTILTEFTPKNLLDAIHNERGTIVWMVVPWALDTLGALDSGEIRKGDYDLSCWRLMHMGGQPIPESVVRRWKEYFPDMKYDASFGQSESGSPGGTHLGLDNEQKLPSIGRSGFNWEARVINDKGEDVAPGEVGEIVLRGNAVMKGYYKNPEKTAEVLRDGWLYTGDLATVDDEGYVYIVDRKKDMICCGGENIYPIEIEEVLHKNPKIKDAAVIGVPDDRLTEVPAAIIQVAEGQDITSEQVEAFCKENLPGYKRPRRVIFGQVPRSPSGKIEKVKLREKYAK